MTTRGTVGSWASQAARLALSRTLLLIGVGGVLTNLGTPVSDVRYPDRLRAPAVRRTLAVRDGESIGRGLPEFRRLSIRRHQSN